MSKASARAYELIKARILDGTLPPGAQLKEEEIAELCGVSRTPVRDAMRRLELEMFIERTDSQRSFVTDWSDDAIDDLFTLRTMLESYAAERAARNMTDGVIDRLRATSAAITEAIQQTPPDIDRFLRENAIFHGLVLEVAASDRLSAMLGRLVLMPVIYRTARRYDLAQLQRSLSEHQEIIAAFVARDPQWASAVMTSHIRRAFHVHVGAIP